MPSVVVKHGWLWDVIGTPAAQDDLLFVPVLASLNDEGEGTPLERSQAPLQYHFSHFLDENNLPDFVEIEDEYYAWVDAIWVRGRIPAIFGFAPLTLQQEDERYSLLEQTFVACEPVDEQENWIAWPFTCADSCLETGLRFSPEGPDEETCQRIASAFWNLFLSEPQTLHPFRAGFFAFIPNEDWSEDVYGTSTWTMVELREDEILIETDEEEWFDEPSESFW